MNRADKPQFGAELAKLAAVLKGQVTALLIEAFWEAFQDYTLADFVAASRKARETLDFMPSIRELKQLLPPKPRPVDPYLAKLLQPFERKEPWPDKAERLLPRAQPQPETDIERAVRERMAGWVKP